MEVSPLSAPASTRLADPQIAVEKCHPMVWCRSPVSAAPRARQLSPAVDKDGQMQIFTPILAVSAFVVVAGFSLPSRAFELDGAWTSQEAHTCNKIFAKAGNTTSFAPDAESHGSGFIVENNSIRGLGSKCTIKARKEAGGVTQLIAVCSTGIMIDQTQLSFKVVDDNKIVRLFPGMDGFETQYVRCSFAN